MERFRLGWLESRVLFCMEGLSGALGAESLIVEEAIDVPVSADAGGDGSDSGGTDSSGGLAVPVLHSLPKAKAKLYLDFDGDYSASWGAFKPGLTPAYDMDGDPTTFSSSELASIQEIWARVAEKYSPFRLDVTTEDPGDLAEGKALRVVLGGDGMWVGARVGGVGYLGGFTNGLPNTVWAFTKNLANGNSKYSAEVAAHEAGHGFGLYHQSTWSGGSLLSEYNRGNNLVAPVMGTSYYSDRGIWFYGTTSNGPRDIQNDMGVIGSQTNGFGFRSDDHGDTMRRADAMTLAGQTFSGQGVIGTRVDVDYFKVNTDAGTLSLKADPARYGATLNLRLELRDANGKLIQSRDTISLGESLSATVSAGTYYIVVASHGTHGDVGQYTISGQFAASDNGNSTPTPPSQQSGRGWRPRFPRRPTVQLRWAETSSTITRAVSTRPASGQPMVRSASWLASYDGSGGVWNAPES